MNNICNKKCVVSDVILLLYSWRISLLLQNIQNVKIMTGIKTTYTILITIKICVNKQWKNQQMYQ
jgi:hypothetical protein